MRKQISVSLNMILCPSSLLHFLNTLANFHQIQQKKGSLKGRSCTAFVNAVCCTLKDQLSDHQQCLSLGAYARGSSWEHPIQNTRGNLRTGRCFLFPPTHIPYHARQLHTQEHPSQGSSHPPNPTPYSRAKPQVALMVARRCMLPHDRENNYTAVPVAWHAQFPTRQHGMLHAHLRLCTTACSSDTPGWQKVPSTTAALGQAALFLPCPSA